MDKNTTFPVIFWWMQCIPSQAMKNSSLGITSLKYPEAHALKPLHWRDSGKVACIWVSLHALSASPHSICTPHSHWNELSASSSQTAPVRINSDPWHADGALHSNSSIWFTTYMDREVVGKFWLSGWYWQDANPVHSILHLISLSSFKSGSHWIFHAPAVLAHEAAPEQSISLTFAAVICVTAHAALPRNGIQTQYISSHILMDKNSTFSVTFWWTKMFRFVDDVLFCTLSVSEGVCKIQNETNRCIQSWRRHHPLQLQWGSLHKLQILHRFGISRSRNTRCRHSNSSCSIHCTRFLSLRIRRSCRPSKGDTHYLLMRDRLDSQRGPEKIGRRKVAATKRQIR